jgi:hypothetical protein
LCHESIPWLLSNVLTTAITWIVNLQSKMV